MGVIRSLRRKLYRPFQGFTEMTRRVPMAEAMGYDLSAPPGRKPQPNSSLGCSFDVNPNSQRQNTAAAA